MMSEVVEAVDVFMGRSHSSITTVLNLKIEVAEKSSSQTHSGLM